MESEFLGNIIFALSMSVKADVGCQLSKDDCINLLVDITHFRQRIAELEAANRWIPVGERLPKRGKIVLVNLSGFVTVGYWEGYWWAFDVKPKERKRGDLITHWMRMPEPKDDEK